MNAQELLSFLYSYGTTIDIEGDDLVIDAPDNILDDSLIEFLGQNKTDILELLRRFKKSAENTLIKHNTLAPYTCTPSLAQERMLFLEDLAGNSSFYNLPFAYRVCGPLNQKSIKQAFQLLIKNHEILRTTYVHNDSGYIQLINLDKNIDIHEMDISACDQKANQLSTLLTAEVNHQFTLSTEWPIRIAIIKLSDSEAVISINLHHIAADGMSARKLINDISNAYNWFLIHPEDTECPSCTTEYQYSDYTYWQKNWLASENYIAAKKYWLNLLKGAPHLHNIPTDFLRPSVQVTQGEFYSSYISASLATRLNSICKLKKITPFVIFQTTFAALLSRYSGEKDILFGIAAANRNPIQFVNSVGLFVNTLAMRYQLTEGTSFSSLLEQVIDVNENGLKYQSFPFDDVVDQLQPQRDLSYNPLIQIMLVMQDNARNELHLNGTKVTPIHQKQKVSKFDFSLHITPHSDSFSLEWEYNSSIFKKSTISNFSNHFIRLLSALVETPEINISAIPLLKPNEIPKALQVDKFQPAQCIHKLIERQINLHPDAIALIDGNRQFTYRELDDNSNRIATKLLAVNNSVKKVGVCLDKSAEMIFAFLAILKINAIYIPLDPFYPKERLEFMIQDSGMDFLISTNVQLTIDINAQIPFLYVDDLLKYESHSVISVNANPDSGAYIIYTSGSTGKPKGVLVSHKSLFYSLMANQLVMKVSNTDVMPTIGSQAFGVSLLEILLPLISGGTVLVLQKSNVLDIDTLIKLTNTVTILHAVPSLMRVWLDLLKEKHTQDMYPNLRLLLVGGEAVPEKLLQDIKSWRSQIRLLELYGMTELAVVCSSYEMVTDSVINYCIGKPHTNAEFYILNESYQHQPVNVAGELHIGGLSLATEYINQPEITREKFIVNPFDHTQLLYKTGDRVKRLADGYYEFLGRTDYQVSVRGIRIECGEIEALTLQIEGVKQAIAHVFNTSADEQILALYFSLSSNDFHADSTISKIRMHLSRYLPDYMRPSVIQKIEKFPLNPNGKVDRKALPQPNDFSSRQLTPILPESDLEKRISTLWKEVLRIENVSVTDNFFQLGGNSLLAARLVRKINLDIDEKFKIGDLFQCANVRESTKIIAQNILMQPTLDIDETDLSTEYSIPTNKLFIKNKPLSVIAHHSGSVYLDIQSSILTEELLTEALSILTKVHPILNSKQYGKAGNLIHTFKYTKEKFNLIYKDFSSLDITDNYNDPLLNCDEYVRSLPLNCFTLTENDNLFKAYLFNCGDTHSKRLFIIWHHSVLDAFSVEIVLSDFDEIVSSLLEGGDYKRQKHYTKITDWYELIKLSAQENYSQDLNYWKNQPWDSVKKFPYDNQQSSIDIEWASALELECMQRLWQDEPITEEMWKALRRRFEEHKLSVQKTKLLYSSVISQKGINAFDLILLAITRALSNWTKSNITLFEVINSARGLIFPEFDNTKTIGDIAFNAPLLVNSALNQPALPELRRLYNERQALPRRALSYKWNKNILLDPEYQNFPQSQILVNYDTGNRYEVGNRLNLINNKLVYPIPHPANYTDIGPGLFAEDRFYFFIDVKDEQLFCQLEIPGYGSDSICKNPYYHPGWAFIISRSIISELDKILDELMHPTSVN